MIDPSGIPQFTGDFSELDKDVSALRTDAIGIRDRGMDIHSRFQMLEAYYTAPEADKLFGTTQPVMDNADGFATKLETVADALDTYSVEARPLAKRLARLKADAVDFVAGVEGHDDWTQDEEKVHRHQELLDGVTSTQSAFQDAERRAASKISSIVGGPKFVTDDGSHTVDKKTVMYGYGLDTLEHAKELPWGSPEEQTYEAWSLDWFGHGAKSFVWDGLVKDNIEGGLDGLYTLFGGHGSQAAGQAWSGLKDVVTGIGLYTITPYDAFMDWAVGPDKESADEIRSKKAAKEFAKSLVAWDKWDENPARASATVVFNVLTLGAGPLAVASKGSKAGALAKGASVAAKVGEFIDPVSAGLKATGKAINTLPKLSDVTSKIFTGVDTSTGAGRLHSVIELDDGSKVVIENGEFVAYDKHGDVISDTPKQEHPGDSQNTPEQTKPSERELAGVGAGSHRPQASAHPDGGFGSPAGHTGSGGRAHASQGVDTHNGGAGHDSRGSGAQERPHGGTAEASHHSSGSDGGAGENHGRHVDDTATPSGDHQAHGNEHGSDRELTPEERKRIQDELVRKANDPEWRKKYYDDRGHRLRKSTKVDGVELPILKKDLHGKWIAKYEMPSGPSETTFGSKPLGRDTVPDGNLPELDKVTADRKVALELTNAEKVYEKTPSPESRATLEEAQKAYDHQLGDVPNNSKISEALGEKAAALHVVRNEFPTAQEITLPKTPNGADMFDQAYNLGGDERLIVEAKAPSGDLDWRQGVADPEDPANPHVGDDGGAQGMRVKQGTLPYVRSILGLMTRRGGRTPKSRQTSARR
ncbi:hypothetical protein [Streptomyces sp. NPDC007264]|uniref:hypothetical protein n=1 Tax=Streptomyces sp. NPDC007264 TaxID=3364777 RepID=UPI0036DA296F